MNPYRTRFLLWALMWAVVFFAVYGLSEAGIIP